MRLLARLFPSTWVTHLERDASHAGDVKITLDEKLMGQNLSDLIVRFACHENTRRGWRMWAGSEAEEERR
jgi:hypothetical protein